jgi:hypothetical protein
MHATRPLVTLNLEGLTDVAPQGEASQISLSKWSSQNDAQRAVQDVSADFAFHTGLEVEPWWVLDLKSVFYPALIIISNRRRHQFWTVARAITVSVSDDGETWRALHAGMINFGTLEGGCPLILPLHGQFGVRFVKITNSGTEPTFLHLSAVNVLVSDAEIKKDSRVTFVSNRTDGLGERLKAIVNSIVLAEFFQGDYSFSWDAISSSVAAAHAIGTPYDIFSHAFIRDHLTERKPTLTLKKFLAAQAKGSQTNRASVIAPHSSIYRISPALREDIQVQALSDAFWSIEFSEKMQTAINAAHAVVLKGKGTGLHMRAGDIVYGRYRFNTRYVDKVVPYPLSIAFIETQKALGNQVILFGQDEDLCRTICERYDTIFAGAYHTEFGLDVHQAAIFDIVLMARCSTVVAGNSGFSQIAQIAGQFAVLDPTNILLPEHAVAAMRRFLSPDSSDDMSVSDLQKAFCRSYVIHMYPEYLTEDEIEEFLRQALDLDPVNSFYGISLAVHLSKTGKYEEATTLLDYLISADFPRESFGTPIGVTRAIHPDGKLALESHVLELKSMADKGSNAAIALYAMICASKREKNAFLEYFEKYRSDLDGSLRPVDDALASLAIEFSGDEDPK